MCIDDVQSHLTTVGLPASAGGGNAYLRERSGVNTCEAETLHESRIATDVVCLYHVDCLVVLLHREAACII